MEYRGITQDEAREAIHLEATSFFFDPSDTLKQLQRDKYHYEFIRGAINDEGKVIGMLEFLPFEAYLDSHIVKMGCIGCVSTQPEHRRSGHVRELFRHLLDEMHEKDYELSYLYPFSHPYYRKFGYELCMNVRQLSAKPDALIRFDQPGRGELFINGEDGSDPEPIINIYTAYASRHNLMLDRDGWWWELRLENDPYKSKIRTYIWYDENERPAAYFTFRYKMQMGDAEMNIRDMAWVDKKGLYGLMGFIGRFAGNVKEITFACPPELHYDYLWPEPYDVKVEVNPGGMARIVDVQKVLELIKKPKQGGEITISVEDAFASWNTGSYHIAWGDGETMVKKIAQQTPDIVCSIEALNQMATGYKGLTEAIYRKDVMVNNKQEILEELFCRKQGFISDHF